VAQRSRADAPLRKGVYAELRQRFLTGRVTPGTPLSTRSLAHELGVSQTPVREALARLAADGAVEIRSKRRILVPPMTEERFRDLLRCRELLEPAAAVAALPQVNAALIAHLREIDERLGQALDHGDVDTYMACNHAFHFLIYGAQPQRMLVQLIETLWLQFGPYMRVVFERYGQGRSIDQHRRAITALRTGRAPALRAAILADLRQGMSLIARDGFATVRRA
jgi:DNA-binding GntR family transcriptional regulator